MRHYILKAADVRGKQSSHQIQCASPSSRAAHIPHNSLPPIFPTGKYSVCFYPWNFVPKDYSQGLGSGYKTHKGIWVGSVAHWLTPFFSKFTLTASIKNKKHARKAERVTRCISTAQTSNCSFINSLYELLVLALLSNSYSTDKLYSFTGKTI